MLYKINKNLNSKLKLMVLLVGLMLMLMSIVVNAQTEITNISLNVTVSSNDPALGDGKQALVDGNNGTNASGVDFMWFSNFVQFDNFFFVDLESVRDIGRVCVSDGAVNCPDSCGREPNAGFNLTFGNNSDFTNNETFINAFPNMDDEDHSYDCFIVNRSARFVRVEAIDSESGSGLRMGEIDIFEQLQPPPPPPPPPPSPPDEPFNSVRDNILILYLFWAIWLFLVAMGFRYSQRDLLFFAGILGVMLSIASIRILTVHILLRLFWIAIAFVNALLIAISLRQGSDKKDSI